VRDAADRFADSEALVDGELRLSFSDLADQALEVTRAAIAIGVSPGDRVAIWAPNSAAWVIAALGLVGSGAVLVPINTRFKGGEAAHVLRSSGARVLFTVQSFLGNDYPSMLAGEDVPDLERIVLLGGSPGKDSSGNDSPGNESGGHEHEPGELYEVTRLDEIPVYGWNEFLAAEDGVVECESAVAGHRVERSDAAERWRSVTATDLSDLMFTS
jgi:acyl-CoA synthetase (AMP-forming)/AMP-acid ligase II